MKVKLVLLVSIILTAGLNHALAQPAKKDTVYYLLDTAKTPPNDRIWSMELESQAKIYTIMCPCLVYGRSPTFFYPVNNKGVIIARKDLRSIKQISLVTLINRVKQVTAIDKAKNIQVFFIEPYGKNYLMHKVGIIEPTKTIKMIDYEDISKPDPTKKPQ